MSGRLPIANKRQFLEVSSDVIEHVTSVFYGDPKAAAFKTLGMNWAEYGLPKDYIVYVENSGKGPDRAH
jgi:hypothetical protein